MPKQPKPDYQQLGKLIENIYETGYADRKRIYRMSFIKGALAGFGGVLGATVMIGLFIWVLSWFDSIPFISNLIITIQNSN